MRLTKRIAMMIVVGATVHAAAFTTGHAAPLPETTDVFHDWMHAHVLVYPTVQQKKEILDAQGLRKLSSRLRLLPTLSGTVEHDWFGNPWTESQNYAARAEINLFRFGADAAEVRKQTATQELDFALLDQAKLVAEQDIADLYFLDFDLRLRQRVLNELGKQDDELQKIGVERYKRGLLPLEEREKLEVDVLNRRAQIESLEQSARDLESRRSALNVTEHLSEWPFLNATSMQKFVRLTEQEIDPAVHPDYRVDALSARVAEANQDQAWATIYPSLDARSAYQSGETLNSPYYAGVNAAWNHSIILTIPLFTGLSSVAEYKEATALKTSAEISREFTRRKLQQEWKARTAQFKQWLNTVKARQHGLEMAERISQASLRRFRAGRESVNDLAVDQERARRAELSLLDAKLEYQRAALKTWQAAGMIWSD